MAKPKKTVYSMLTRAPGDIPRLSTKVNYNKARAIARAKRTVCTGHFTKVVVHNGTTGEELEFTPADCSTKKLRKAR